MSKRTLSLAVCLLAVFSISAYAVDGQILITQASVNAAGGFPYKINSSGSYKLGSNLIVPAGPNGIQILADSVSLDLNGFSIIGPATCDGDDETPTRNCSGGTFGVGVTSSNAHITVRNGTIRGMGAGIEITTATGGGTLIEEMHVTKNNGFGIALSGSGLIRRNVVSNNLATGISVSESSLVSDNIANANGDNGIEANDSTVTNNSSGNNRFVGLVVSGGLYGGNSLFNQLSSVVSVPDFLNHTAVSQNNNNCNGTLC